MPSVLLTFFLGFILGIKHAVETDHIAAVATIVTKQKSPSKAALTGAFWGIGHTSTLLIFSSIILLFKITFAATLSLYFELLVGIMLVILGIQVFFSYTIPFFSKTSRRFNHTYKSLLVGSIHGLAGTGALMLLILSTIQSTQHALLYILCFGIGSIIGMSVMSYLFSLPLLFSQKKFPLVEKQLKRITGVVSVIFGVLIIYQLLFVEEILSLL